MRQFNRVHVSEVGSFEGGPLEIRVRCIGPYSLQVTGRSVLDFSYQLSAVQNPETGETKRLLGSPVKGNDTCSFFFILHYNILKISGLISQKALKFTEIDRFLAIFFGGQNKCFRIIFRTKKVSKKSEN